MSKAILPSCPTCAVIANGSILLSTRCEAMAKSNEPPYKVHKTASVTEICYSPCLRIRVFKQVPLSRLAATLRDSLKDWLCRSRADNSAADHGFSLPRLLAAIDLSNES